MKRALITGGAGGIGAAIVDSLQGDGVACAVADLKTARAPIDGVHYMAVDIADEDGIAVMERSLNDNGFGQIDYLVHCAAVLHHAPFRETSRADWQRVIRTNLEGSIAVTQAVVPLMSKGGRIVLFASGTVFKGPPNLFAYVAAKAGVIGLARCLAEELGEDDITVNVICPGITATSMIQDIAHTEQANIASRALRRRAWPEDIVGPVRFLLSDGAAFVTGQTLCVDGGSVKH